MSADDKSKKPDAKLAAKLWKRDGLPAQDALRQAGFSPNTSKQGMKYLARKSAPLRKAIKAEVDRKLKELELLGTKLSPAQRAAVIRGGLLKNGVLGEQDRRGSTRALELMGRDKEVGLFEPDVQVGILSMGVPNNLKDLFYSLPEPAEDAGNLEVVTRDGRDYIIRREPEIDPVGRHRVLDAPPIAPPESEERRRARMSPHTREIVYGSDRDGSDRDDKKGTN